MQGTIGERLKRARENVGLKQNEVCELLEIPKAQTLSAYERDVNNPPLETLSKLARLYHVSIDWIVCGEETHTQRAKTTTDYITDLFTSIDKLGLKFIEDTNWNGKPTGVYIVSITNKKLKCFDLLISDLFKLSEVRGVLEADDYETLIQKKIRSRASESNNFEEIEEMPSQTLYNPPEEDDGQLPF